MIELDELHAALILGLSRNAIELHEPHEPFKPLCPVTQELMDVAAFQLWYERQLKPKYEEFLNANPEYSLSYQDFCRVYKRVLYRKTGTENWSDLNLTLGIMELEKKKLW